MNKTTFSILLFFLLISCEQKKDETTEKEAFENLIEQKNEIIISNLKEKYSIMYKLDTMDYAYSIQFENMLKTRYELIKFFIIQDIYSIDSVYYVNIISDRINKNCYFNLRIPETEIEKLLSLKEPSSPINYAAIVV